MDKEKIDNLLLNSPVVDVQDRYEEEIDIDDWDDPLDIAQENVGQDKNNVS